MFPNLWLKKMDLTSNFAREGIKFSESSVRRVSLCSPDPTESMQTKYHLIHHQNDR